MGPPLRKLAVGWDLDGTLARSAHRKFLIPLIHAGEASWEDYHALCPKDEPIEGAVTLLRLMRQMNPQVQHIAISFRSYVALGRTREWCWKNDVPLDRFMLCPEALAHTSAPVPGPSSSSRWKIQCIRQLRSEGIEVQVHLEDWLEDAQAITEATGVPVLRCTEVGFG